MATNYPGNFDTFHKPQPDDKMSLVSHADLHTEMAEAIEALQREIGTYPKGLIHQDVAERLDEIESHAGNSISKAGDTMAGPLDLDGNALTGLPAPAAPDEPLRDDEIAQTVHGDWSVELAQWLRASSTGTATVVVVGDSIAQRKLLADPDGPAPLSWVVGIEERIARISGTAGQPAGAAGWEPIGEDSSAWATDGTVGAGLGGFGVTLTGSQSVSRTRTCDAIELVFLDGGVAEVTVDGATVTVDTDGGVVWSSGPLALGAHTLAVAVDSGTVVLSGARHHVGTLGRIVVDNGGHAGWGYQEHLASGTIDHIALTQPDLVVLACGLNDYRLGRDVPDETEAMADAVRAVAPDASLAVFVQMQPQPQGIGVVYEDWHLQATEIRRRARAIGAAVLDLVRAVGNPAPPELFTDVAGPGLTDWVHPNASGHAALADAAWGPIGAKMPLRARLASAARVDALTAADVGALPITGGTVSGLLGVESSEPHDAYQTKAFEASKSGDSHPRFAVVLTPEALGGLVPTGTSIVVGDGATPPTVAWNFWPGTGMIGVPMGVQSTRQATLPAAPPATTWRLTSRTTSSATEVGIHFPAGFVPLAIEGHVSPPPVTVAVAASRAFAAGDRGATLLASAALTLTLASLSTWRIGESATIIQTGAGAVTVAAGGGQTLHAPNGAASTAQGQEGTLRRLAASVWSINWVAGDIDGGTP